MTTTADRIREARIAAGLTQTQLATHLGAHQSTVSAWESGTLPKTTHVKALARALGVSADWLLGITED